MRFYRFLEHFLTNEIKTTSRIRFRIFRFLFRSLTYSQQHKRRKYIIQITYHRTRNDNDFRKYSNFALSLSLSTVGNNISANVQSCKMALKRDWQWTYGLEENIKISAFLRLVFYFILIHIYYLSLRYRKLIISLTEIIQCFMHR